MEQSKEPQPVPDYINRMIKDTMFMNGNNTDAEKSIFLKASEYGYSLAASEISTLQKTVERLATEKRELKEEVAVHEKTIEEQKKEIEKLNEELRFLYQKKMNNL